MSWSFITNNTAWKLGALFLAVLLWLTIADEPELIAIHSVPILYKDLNPNLLIGSDAPSSVRVELRGPASKLSTSSLADISILLDLSNTTGPGQRTFTLSGSDLHLPEGVNFLRAVPSQLRLTLARRVSKLVPIDVQISALPPGGYRIVKQDVAPAEVNITGPEARVAAITRAQTDPINLSTATQSTDIRTNVYIADPQVSLQDSPIVMVHFEIEKISQ